MFSTVRMHSEIKDVGIFTSEDDVAAKNCQAGDVGYIIAGIK